MPGLIDYITEFLLDEIDDIRLRLTHPIQKTWAVTKGNSVLTKSGEWEYEGMSSREDTFFMSATRYASVVEAVAAYRNYWDNHVSYVIALGSNPARWTGYTLVNESREAADEFYDNNVTRGVSRVVLLGKNRCILRQYAAPHVTDHLLPRTNPIEWCEGI